MLDDGLKVEPVITASRGSSRDHVGAAAATRSGGYRAMFDLVPGPGTEPITLRLYLRVNGQPLSETWLYQWTPPPLAQRAL